MMILHHFDDRAAKGPQEDGGSCHEARTLSIAGEVTTIQQEALIGGDGISCEGCYLYDP